MTRIPFSLSGQKTCVAILGQHAVGKLVVGEELSRRTGYQFLHHRVVHDLVASVWGSEMSDWEALRQHFRNRILEKTVSSEAEGFIFSCIWDFGNIQHRRGIEQAREILVRSGWRMVFVELTSAIHRKGAAPLALTRFLSGYDFPYGEDHLLVSRDDLSVESVVDRILVRFDLAALAESHA